jgi:hypothetical protein
MKRKNPTCIDCNCTAISHTTERHGLQLTMEEITFSCGSRQKETFTTNGNIAKVEFIGCNCAG